jgi:hypothetical protein
MRYQTQLQLDKDRALKDQMQENREAVMQPVRKLVNLYYNSAVAWWEPALCSLSRLDVTKEKASGQFINTTGENVRLEEPIVRDIPNKIPVSFSVASSSSNHSVNRFNE